MDKQWKRPENLFVPDAKKAALVIIDMQNFTCAPIGREPLPHIDTVIRQINHLVDFCRGISIPIIWVQHNFTTTATQRHPLAGQGFKRRYCAKFEPLFHIYAK